MTQTARKGKLYQLQCLIDLSCFILSHASLCLVAPICDLTKLIYFTDTSHEAEALQARNRWRLSVL
jgi:hypothetical protein